MHPCGLPTVSEHHDACSRISRLSLPLESSSSKMSSSKSKSKLSVLSDKQFAKLFEDCKLELKLRIERESKVAYKVETRKEEQQTTKLSHLSDLKFKIVLLDAVLEFEGRFKENQLEAVAVTEATADNAAATCTSANSANTKKEDEHLNPQDDGYVDHRKHRDSLLLAMLKLDTNVAHDRSVDDRNTPPSSPHRPSYPQSSTHEKNSLSRSTTISLPPAARQVTRMAEKSRIQLGYLLKCYSIALSPNPGVVIKQMKSCIAALRDLSEIVDGYVEDLKSSGTRRGDKTCMFLECMVQLIGSSIRVIMANFSPNLEGISSEAIRIEIGKIVFMVDSLQLALSISNASSGVLPTSKSNNGSGSDSDSNDDAIKSLSNYTTLEIKHLIKGLEEKCPVMRPPPPPHSQTKRLDPLLSPLHVLQTDFKRFLKTSFQPAFLTVLLDLDLGRACNVDGEYSIRKLVQFLVVQVSALLQETRSKSKGEQSKSEPFIQVVNDALQALVSVYQSTRSSVYVGEIGGSEYGHDCMVELMEGMYDLERGLEGLLDLESLQMQMPKPDDQLYSR